MHIHWRSAIDSAECKKASDRQSSCIGILQLILHFASGETHLLDQRSCTLVVHAVLQQDFHGLLLSFQAPVESGTSLAMSCASSCSNSQRGYLMKHESNKDHLTNKTGNARRYGPDDRSLDAGELL
jgi:hypothetical protein